MVPPWLRALVPQGLTSAVADTVSAADGVPDTALGTRGPQGALCAPCNPAPYLTRFPLKSPLWGAGSAVPGHSRSPNMAEGRPFEMTSLHYRAGSPSPTRVVLRADTDRAVTEAQPNSSGSPQGLLGPLSNLDLTVCLRAVPPALLTAVAPVPRLGLAHSRRPVKSHWASGCVILFSTEKSRLQSLHRCTLPAFCVSLKWGAGVLGCWGAGAAPGLLSRAPPAEPSFSVQK